MKTKVGTIGRFLGVISALLSGCGEHVVVVSLEKLSPEAQAISVYYKMEPDGVRSKSLSRDDLAKENQSFGIRPPTNRVGPMSIRTFTYKDNLPCALNKGAIGAEVQAAGKMEVLVPLENGAATPNCSANDPPVRYPQEAKVWAGSDKNVWIVGKDAAVLHWDGALFHEIVIPQDLLNPALPPNGVQNPDPPVPTWNGVVGDVQGNVWLAGTNQTVIKFDKDKRPFRIKSQPTATPNRQLDYTGVDSKDGQVLFSGSELVSDKFFVGKCSAIENTVTTDEVKITSSHIYAVSCTTATDCWFAGNDSALIHQKDKAVFEVVKVGYESSCGGTGLGLHLRSIIAHANPQQVKAVGFNYGSDQAALVSFDMSLGCFMPITRTLPNQGGLKDPTAAIHRFGQADPIIVSANSMYRLSGSTWEPLPVSGEAMWRSVYLISDKKFFATDSSGRIYAGTGGR